MGLGLRGRITKTQADVNEDIGTYWGRAAWILDGSSGLVAHKVTTGASDAQWYVSQWDKYLRDKILDCTRSIPDILSEGMAFIKKQYDSFADARHISNLGMPSAAIALIRECQDGVIEYFVLGDCSILISLGEQVHYLIDDKIGKFDSLAVRELKKLQRKGLQFSKIRQELMPLLRKNRELKNTKEGYWILGFDKEAIAHGLQGQIPVEDKMEVLMMSDGFSQIQDVFYKFRNERELISFVSANGLQAAYAELCELQAADPECEKFPRLKRSDDCTALFLG
ncbi:hypothetical protein [Cellulosilyticum sp. I15G10I2]|uniref:hypothetical protein n=1 Tax=Cellulosilyticum sp. I15G10I2 TaxID=1892843 RepID=UPI00085C728D|nr:hypothetical protein [Cellulosilyticum sp. I15G10I2]